MRNDEFGPYYGSHKQSKDSVIQRNVLRKKTKRKTRIFRADDELDRKIENKCQEKNKKFSVLNRILWEAYFEVEKNRAWQKEVEGWEEKPKLKQVI